MLLRFSFHLPGMYKTTTPHIISPHIICSLRWCKIISLLYCYQFQMLHFILPSSVHYLIPDKVKLQQHYLILFLTSSSSEVFIASVQKHMVGSSKVGAYFFIYFPRILTILDSYDLFYFLYILVGGFFCSPMQVCYVGGIDWHLHEYAVPIALLTYQLAPHNELFMNCCKYVWLPKFTRLKTSMLIMYVKSVY